MWKAAAEWTEEGSQWSQWWWPAPSLWQPVILDHPWWLIGFKTNVWLGMNVIKWLLLLKTISNLKLADVWQGSQWLCSPQWLWPLSHFMAADWWTVNSKDSWGIDTQISLFLIKGARLVSKPKKSQIGKCVTNGHSGCVLHNGCDYCHSSLPWWLRGFKSNQFLIDWFTKSAWSKIGFKTKEFPNGQVCDRGSQWLCSAQWLWLLSLFIILMTEGF